MTVFLPSSLCSLAGIALSEPLNIMFSINVAPQVAGDEKDYSSLVSSSRTALSPDFDEIALNRLQPIYRDLVSFSAEINRRHNLAELENRQLRNVEYAARDTLLILGEATQLNREMNRNMNDDNAHVRAAFDSLRCAMLEFLAKLRDLDLALAKQDLEVQLEARDAELNAGESSFAQELNQLLEKDLVSADAAASLFNSATLVRSICQQLLRASRHVSDAAAAYDDVEIELEDGNEALPAD